MKRAGLLFLLLLAATLPFDVPVIRWPGIPVSISHLEILLALAGMTALIQQGRAHRCAGSWRNLPASWRWLWLAVILAALLSAYLAPAFRWNAFTGAARLLAGMALAVATLQLVVSGRQATWLMAALAGGGLAAAVVGLLEVAAGAPFAWLALFRPGPTLAGPFLRLTGPFNHANQAAMYLEAILPMWLAAMVCSWQRRQWRGTAVLLAANLLLLQALLLTLSRAGLLIGLLTGVATVVLLWQGKSRGSYGRLRLSLVAAGLLLLVMAVEVWASPALQMRLLSEDDADWYQVRLEAPSEVQMEVGQVVEVPVAIHHIGRHPWPLPDHYPIRLGAHWYRESDNYRLDAELRWPLPEILNPGESVRLTVPLRALQQPGRYRLEWDLVQEYVTWFSHKSGMPAVSRVSVEPGDNVPDAAATPELFRPVEPPAAPIPRRRVLWDVAWRQFLVYPWGGIGLDNFRFTYGRFLAGQHWNNTIHSNNWYLEMLVSLGLLGALPFFAWLGLLWRELAATVRWPGAVRSPATAGQIVVAVALAAFALHGLVDTFLMDRATGWLFWIVVGLWLAQRGDHPGHQGLMVRE